MASMQTRINFTRKIKDYRSKKFKKNKKKLIGQIVGPNFIYLPFRILRENYTSVEILKREIRVRHLRNNE